MKCKILQIRIIGKWHLLKLFGLQSLQIIGLGLQLDVFVLERGDLFGILLQHILLIEDLDVVAVLLLGVSVLVLLAQTLCLLLLDLISVMKI